MRLNPRASQRPQNHVREGTKFGPWRVQAYMDESLIVGFIAGGLLRIYSELFRIRVRRLAGRFDREQSGRIADLMTNSPFYYRWMMYLQFLVWPERLTRNLELRFTADGEAKGPS